MITRTSSHDSQIALLPAQAPSRLPLYGVRRDRRRQYARGAYTHGHSRGPMRTDCAGNVCPGKRDKQAWQLTSRRRSLFIYDTVNRRVTGHALDLALDLGRRNWRVESGSKSKMVRWDTGRAVAFPSITASCVACDAVSIVRTCVEPV